MGKIHCSKHTQGNALFCTQLCSCKCRMPTRFESTSIVIMCFSWKMIGKLSNFFLAFCWRHILTMSSLSKVCSTLLSAKTQSHNRDHFIQLKWRYCLCPWNFLNVTCFLFLSLSSLQSVCLQISKPSFFCLFFYFAHTDYTLQVKMINNHIFVL